MPSDFTDDLRLAHVLADDADALSQARFKALDLHVMTKPDLTPVTDADKSVEEGIRRTLSRARSRDAVVGEETGSTGHSQRRWVVDPIDGTKNFLRGVPVWATLIALMVDDEVVVGVVSAPMLNRRWWAMKGGGAWTGKSLHARDRLPGLRRLPGRGRLAVLLLAVRAGTSAAGSTTSCRCPAAAGAPGRTATSGPTCSSPRGPSTSPPSPSSSSTTWPRSTSSSARPAAYFTSLDGEPGPTGGSALATNGKLHDQALAFLGSLPDRDEPRPAGTVHDLSARRGDPAGDRDS